MILLDFELYLNMTIFAKVIFHFQNVNYFRQRFFVIVCIVSINGLQTKSV